jgi:hypothetical protein
METGEGDAMPCAEDGRAGFVDHEERDGRGDVPNIVKLIRSAIECGHGPDPDRREARRFRYNVIARLSLFSDAPNDEPRRLFTWDASTTGMGFVACGYIPVSRAGHVSVLCPDGVVHKIRCTVTRCRPLAFDWHEGALHFTSEQPAFSEDKFVAGSQAPNPNLLTKL